MQTILMLCFQCSFQIPLSLNIIRTHRGPSARSLRSPFNKCTAALSHFWPNNVRNCRQTEPAKSRLKNQRQTASKASKKSSNWIASRSNKKFSSAAVRPLVQPLTFSPATITELAHHFSPTKLLSRRFPTLPNSPKCRASSVIRARS